MSGLYRDPRTGVFYGLDADDKPSDLAVPAKLAGKESAPPADIWQGAAIEYRSAPNAKAGTAVAPATFAVLLVSSDAEQSAVQYVRYLLQLPEADPRQPALIRGALNFAGTSAPMQQWRDALLATMRTGQQRYSQQEGDPTQLGKALDQAVQARAVYLQVAPGSQDSELLGQIAESRDRLTLRLAIAAALREAALWDEYLIKFRQLELVTWSVPNFLQNTRQALDQSAELHRKQSQEFAAAGHLDRAFDEAALSAVRKSCDASLSTAFANIRVKLVNRNMIASAPEYAGPNKELLEQIVRELESLDPLKAQRIREIIRQGETWDADYLPLQWKKADFLDRLGEYREALAVISRIERSVPLDRKQLEECLKLDSRIEGNLAAAIQKSKEDTRKHFDNQNFQAALDAVALGLKADPGNASLLYYRALSAAFLRQNDVAVESIRTYLRDANLLCSATDEPDTMLELYRLLLARKLPREESGGDPNWVSGRRYATTTVFYDPISMSFNQQVVRIAGKGLSTIFQWEARSFLLRSITTQKDLPSGSNVVSNTAGTTLFEARPKYDRKALYMLEIQAPMTLNLTNNSVTENGAAYPLTYWNSPSVDPDLVLHFTNRQIARGWAGNPFFHPFIWNGFYLFDLAYDQLGRVTKATPIREDAGSRPDPFSEPLEFAWEGNSNRLLSIKGTHSGYLRELRYSKNGRLEMEQITRAKGRGWINYEYQPDGKLLKAANCTDDFYDKNERTVIFDPNGRMH
jgi:hypothetical protein